MQNLQSAESTQPGPDAAQIDGRRRETMLRIAKYSAPAMLALLLSGKDGVAGPVISER